MLLCDAVGGKKRASRALEQRIVVVVVVAQRFAWRCFMPSAPREKFTWKVYWVIATISHHAINVGALFAVAMDFWVLHKIRVLHCIFFLEGTSETIGSLLQQRRQ